MKCPVQCAEEHESACNFTKYCACHEKRLWWLILLARETSITMRGATGVILQRRIKLRIDTRHIWNVQYNARSNKLFTLRGAAGTSPNIAPATKFWIQDFTGKSLNYFRQYTDDSTTIRTWSDHEIVISTPSPRTRRFGDLTRPVLETHFVWKKQHFALRLRLSPKISRNAAPAEKRHYNFTKYCACHEKWISTLLDSTLVCNSRLFSPILCSTVLFSTILCSSILYSTILSHFKTP